MARAEIVDAALRRLERADAPLDDVFDVNEIALLVAVLENARTILPLASRICSFTGPVAADCRV